MGDILVVKSKVGEYIKGKDMHMSADTADKLSELVMYKLDMAVKRCKENGRKTIKPYDL